MNYYCLSNLKSFHIFWAFQQLQEWHNPIYLTNVLLMDIWVERNGYQYPYLENEETEFPRENIYKLGWECLYLWQGLLTLT